MRPITINNPNVTKGPSNSQEFNKLRQDIHTDLTSLFNVVNAHDGQIAENMDHVLRENYFLQNRIIHLQEKVKEVESRQKDSGSTWSSKFTKSFFHSSSSVNEDPNKPVHVDYMHGIVAPVIVQQHDKIAYKNDLGEYILPSDLEVGVYETTDVEPIDKEVGQRYYYQVDGSGIEKAFDGNKNTFWVRKSEFPETKCVTEAYGIVHVKIPQKLSNNVYTNTIVLHPSPEYSMSIMDIQYMNQNGEWKRLETYPVQYNGASEVPVEINEAGKQIFSFPKRQITELKIVVKQPYWFKNNNRRVFMYGFQDIVVEYREFSQNAAEFVTKFSLEDTDRVFTSVGMPSVKAPIGCAYISDYSVKHELYFDEGLTEQFEFSTDIYQPIQAIYVKTILQTAGDMVPILREIELPYQYEDRLDI